MTHMTVFISFRLIFILVYFIICQRQFLLQCFYNDSIIKKNNKDIQMGGSWMVSGGGWLWVQTKYLVIELKLV